MFLFAEVAAAAVAMTVSQSAPQHRPANTAPAKPATAAARHLAACKRAYPTYDARSDTYRIGGGKPIRCTK